MKRWTFYLIMALTLGSIVVSARSTKRKGLRPSARPVVANVERRDTITDSTAMAALVRISDFKKAVMSRVETIMVTNLSENDTIYAFDLDIDYLTPDGRQLNRRRVTFKETVPPGQTRHASVQSWDRQQLFYYRDTPPARPTQRTSAFTVVLRPLQVITNCRE